MNWLRLLCLLSVAGLIGCGPQVGPVSEPADPAEEVIDEAVEAASMPEEE